MSEIDKEECMNCLYSDGGITLDLYYCSISDTTEQYDENPGNHKCDHFLHKLPSKREK